LPLLEAQTQLKEVEVKIGKCTPDDFEAFITSMPKRVQHLTFLLLEFEDFEQRLVLVLNCNRQYLKIASTLVSETPKVKKILN
jgi:hypothetical protein